MLRPSVTSLPGHIQSVLVQNVLKLYTHILVQWESEVPTEKSLRLLALSKQRATAAALAKQNGSVSPEVRRPKGFSLTALIVLLTLCVASRRRCESSKITLKLKSMRRVGHAGC